MAGGKGERIWPIADEKKPKQFMKIDKNETLIQKTVKRILPIIPMEKIFISTSYKYLAYIKEQIPEIPDENIIVETARNNTAPAIALSSLVIKRKYEDANIVILPSDHIVKNEKVLRDMIIKYSKALYILKDAIITFGIKPTRAETQYGYIKVRKGNNYTNENVFYEVKEFVEKPNVEKAEEYILEGNYYWNSGIIMTSLNTIISNIKEWLPKTYEVLKDILELQKEKISKYIEENYKLTDSVSIDYAVLEKTQNIYVVPVDIGWEDMGSIHAVEKIASKDEVGNISIGEVGFINSESNFIIAHNKRIIIEKVNNLYVIENDDGIFIGQRENLSNMDRIREKFNKGEGD